ncbi:hypothetical protein [Singulisphaera sp. GP187]|uniref:hypothetical protein n=1 Tax=Singulisphaera sp. GP187 TaxID=1882752 RepID=UPI001161553A|nr:hypothetical protein [Singulisphaera sp. GP187]
MIVRLSRRFDAIPVLRLDGSSLKEYMNLNVAWLAHGATRNFFASRFTPTSSRPHDLFWGALLLFYGTFGLFGVAYLVFLLVVVGREAVRRPMNARLGYLVFPLLIIINYLVMSLGLAFNNKPPAHPEELLHRPLVWAYFVVVAWVGGLAYAIFLEERIRRSSSLRNAFMVGAVVLLVVPFSLGQSVQVGPEWGRELTNQAYPRGWFECARYIREHASAGDVVQDSEGDPNLMVGAIGEHSAYAIDYFDTLQSPILLDRLEEMRVFKAMTDADAIRRFAARRQIRWYVTHPETRLRWPGSLLNHPKFSWSGYCVYSFPR